MAEEKKMNAKEAQSPIRVQFPNPNKIICKDCVFRDHTVIDVGDKELHVGTTKAYCDMYQKPPASNGKPHEILFEGKTCELYAKEE